MKIAVAVIFIAVFGYLGLVAFTGYNAYKKYEKSRNEYGQSCVKFVDVGKVELGKWISEFDCVNDRVTAGKIRFEDQGYQKDALALLGKKLSVDGMIDVYLWDMPKFNIVNNSANMINAKRLLFRLKHGLIGDKI